MNSISDGQKGITIGIVWIIKDPSYSIVVTNKNTCTSDSAWKDRFKSDMRPGYYSMIAK
ncbi:MAG TPA: hypothetical protein VJ551_03580 [Nitrososphaeraceae archaeon]|nr:hypothetical protein [Nitrososphaeraceae archaeon]